MITLAYTVWPDACGQLVVINGLAYSGHFCLNAVGKILKVHISVVLSYNVMFSIT